jgi:hypothetical protein
VVSNMKRRLAPEFCRNTFVRGRAPEVREQDRARQTIPRHNHAFRTASRRLPRPDNRPHGATITQSLPSLPHAHTHTHTHTHTLSPRRRDAHKLVSRREIERSILHVLIAKGLGHKHVVTYTVDCAALRRGAPLRACAHTHTCLTHTHTHARTRPTHLGPHDREGLGRPQERVAGQAEHTHAQPVAHVLRLQGPPACVRTRTHARTHTHTHAYIR